MFKKKIITTTLAAVALTGGFTAVAANAAGFAASPVGTAADATATPTSTVSQGQALSYSLTGFAANSPMTGTVSGPVNQTLTVNAADANGAVSGLIDTTNLTPGNYTASFTDNQNLTSTVNFVVTQSSTATSTVTITAGSPSASSTATPTTTKTVVIQGQQFTYNAGGLTPNTALTATLAGPTPKTIDDITTDASGKYSGVLETTDLALGDYVLTLTDPTSHMSLTYDISVVQTDSASATPTGSASATPTDSASATPTDSASATPTDSASATPTGSNSATPTDSASATPTGSASATPTSTTINGVIFTDNNGNGVQDTGESDTPNAAVVLMDMSGKTIANAVTDSNGTFTFANVADGNYVIQSTNPSSGLVTSWTINVKNGTYTVTGSTTSNPSTSPSNSNSASPSNAASSSSSASPSSDPNCKELGRTNIPSTDPQYRSGLDTDHDGIACESTNSSDTSNANGSSNSGNGSSNTSTGSDSSNSSDSAGYNKGTTVKTGNADVGTNALEVISGLGALSLGAGFALRKKFKA